MRKIKNLNEFAENTQTSRHHGSTTAIKIMKYNLADAEECIATDMKFQAREHVQFVAWLLDNTKPDEVISPDEMLARFKKEKTNK